MKAAPFSPSGPTWRSLSATGCEPLDYDLSGMRRSDETVRPLHNLIERLCGRQAGEHNVGIGGDLGRRPRRHASDLLDLGKRAAAIAKHAVAALDQILQIGSPILPSPTKPIVSMWPLLDAWPIRMGFMISHAESFVRSFQSCLSLSRSTLPRSFFGRSATMSNLFRYFCHGRLAWQCAITPAEFKPLSGRGTT